MADPGADVLIVGAGAMGGVLAAEIEGSVRRLVVLDASPEHAARMRAPGLVIEGIEGDRTVPLDARTDPDQLDGRFDFALITVKAPQIEAALEPLVAGGSVETYVSLGNGLVQDRVGAVVGDRNLIVGVMEYGATNLGPGRIRKTAPGAVFVGEPDGVLQPRTERLLGALAEVPEAAASANVAATVWSKVLCNITLAGLAAVSGMRTGEIATAPDGLAAAIAVWSEGYLAAAAQGLALSPNFGSPSRDYVPAEVGLERAEKAMRHALEAAAGVTPSMLQDLEAGRRTEVDVINGAVAAKARSVGLAGDANARVTELVHEIEAGNRRSAPELLGVVAAAGRAALEV